MYLHLETSSYAYCTREPYDEWDRGDSAREWAVHGVHLAPHDGEHALPVDFDVVVGDIVHAVYAVYSTGDTFGHDAGAYLEVLSFNKDAAMAARNCASAKANQGELTIEFDSGGVVRRQRPWDGYFESLDYVHHGAYRVRA